MPPDGSVVEPDRINGPDPGLAPASDPVSDRVAGEAPEPAAFPGLTEIFLRGLADRYIGFRRKSRGERRAVRMVPNSLVTDGRRLRYSVSDNVGAHGPESPGRPPIWAVNIHGYFAGGTMYWRESANLAEALGWRVINPTLPGFAGSDPLPWPRVSIGEISHQVIHILDTLEVERAVLLGHSMGGAVAVRIADAHPDRVLGIVYRDGAATPEWKNRRGAVVTVLSPLMPGAANLIDLSLSVVIDSPDLLIGRRLSSTMKGLWPDAQQNLRAFYKIMPVGSMLMSLDMREEVSRLRDNDIPVLAEWGCFDRVVTARTAQEFCDLTGTRVVWVPGGHSWMLPRPSGQADILRHLPAGRDFIGRVTERRHHLAESVSASAAGDFGSAGGSAAAGAAAVAATAAGAGSAAAVAASLGAAVVEPIDIFRRSNSS
ncbi:MAG: alpha/beta fold hydrolase [Acidimicrobiales bacterium]